MYGFDSLRNIGLGCALFAWVVATGCESTITSGSDGGTGGTSSSSSSSSSSSTSSSGVAGMGGEGGAGGAGGSGEMLPACDMGTRASFAVDKLFLGDTNLDGTANPTNGWKAFGFNIDGRISTKTSTDLCKPTAGGTPAAAYPDGDNGIDNSFGKNILPILLGLASDLSITNNESIAMGYYTYLLSIADADQDQCTTSSSFFLGGNLGQPPAFNGSDVWPIDALSLIDPTKADSAKCVYTSTRLEGGLVQAAPPSQFDLVLNVSGFTMVLPVRQSRMAFKLETGVQGISEGNIGGVIRTEDLVKEIAKIAAAFDTSFCDPQSPTLISILNQIRQGSDIMQDGTQDPTKECDGISIGLGFTMKPVQLGTVAPPPVPPADPCMP